MSELADINARIDRLNAKLKADPIVVVGKWPWDDHAMLGDRPRDPEWRLWATYRDQMGLLHGGMATIILKDYQRLSMVSFATEAMTSSDNYESAPHHVKLFARKIQLAILERLTG